MYVFRDGRKRVSGAALISALSATLIRWRYSPEPDSEDAALSALVAAGELECALLDESSDSSVYSCNIATKITENLAGALLTGEKHLLQPVAKLAEQLRVRGDYQIAVQEGFAYYALHPRKLAILLRPWH